MTTPMSSTAEVSHSSEGLRPIRTARTLAAIEEGRRAGFWPLVKAVNVCPAFESWVGVYQDPQTGKVHCFTDQRYGPERVGLVKVLDWQAYCPVTRQLPFAAYLLPADLQIGETVWIEDLIEDYPDLEKPGKQRLMSSKARWNGQDFEVRTKLNSRVAIFGRPDRPSDFYQGLFSD